MGFFLDLYMNLGCFLSEAGDKDQVQTPKGKSFFFKTCLKFKRRG